MSTTRPDEWHRTVTWSGTRLGTDGEWCEPLQQYSAVTAPPATGQTLWCNGTLPLFSLCRFNPSAPQIRRTMREPVLIIYEKKKEDDQ